MYVVFDLDGTLADLTHRLHHIQKDPKDWDSFFSPAEVSKDAPIREMLNVYQDLVDAGNLVEVWSGRSDVSRLATTEWLWRWTGIRVLSEKLRMRPDGDHQDDERLKAGWLEEVMAHGEKPNLVFDDRQRVVDMWRSYGIRCCQVAEGNF